MKIQKIEVKNYRGLDGVSVSFDSNESFIVGKNNIGKTSTLDLLSTILSGNDFKSSDFQDEERPIIANARLLLSEEEIGMFDDNFDSSEENSVTIQVTQADPVSQVKIIADVSGDNITKNQIQKSNYIGFSSSRKPIQENDLTRQIGSYKLIPHLVRKFSENKSMEIPETERDNQAIINYINEHLLHIKPFRDNQIHVGMETNYFDYITRSLRVQSKEGVDFSKLGFGTQFSSLIPLVLIDQLISWSRYQHLDEHLCSDNNGGQELHIILGLDEPEVHLHPNLQFAVREDIETLLLGNDQEFNKLVKDLFNVDKVTGQMIVVTHSPAVLSNDYHQYIRYSSEINGLQVTSGQNLTLSSNQHKQLMMQLPNVKAALFADAVILVEGETEYGALPVFASKLGISLVRANVNIVNAGGVKSTTALKCLFNNLGIKCLSIIDKDDGNKATEDVFVTNQRDFEDECFELMGLRNIHEYFKIFYGAIEDSNYDGSFWDRYFSSDYKSGRIEALKAHKDVYEYVEKYFTAHIDSKLVNEDNILSNLRTSFIRGYLKKKSVLNGAIIAQCLEGVPETYKKALNEAAK